MAGYTEQLGAKHPRALSAKMNLASVLVAAGSPREAIVLHEQVVQTRSDLLGAQHTDSLIAKINLGQALVAVDEDAAALKHYKEALSGLRSLLGESHSTTLSAKLNLANLLHKVLFFCRTALLRFCRICNTTRWHVLRMPERAVQNEHRPCCVC